eukprot:GILI01003082.1.p1 GENE.GILI01003082.1~~GILI01003082.1.p1  ORF type:complete len:363 (-),score=153.64 GILI01003082.1:321-1409(-)
MSLIRNTARLFAAPSSARCFSAAASPASGAPQTVSDLFETKPSRFLVKDAVRFQNQKIRWTYAELKKFTDALASGFLEQGFKAGDKIALWMDNSAELLVSQLAAARAGLVAVGIDGTHSAAALASVLNETQAKALIFSPNARTSAADATRRIEVLEQVLPGFTDVALGAPFRSSKFPSLTHLIHTGPKIVPGTAQFKHALVYSPQPSPLNKVSVSSSSPFLSEYSEGKRKGDVVSQGVALQAISLSSQHLQLSLADKLLVAAPLSHNFTAVAGVLTGLANTAEVVVAPEFASADSLVSLIAAEQPTVLLAESGSLPSGPSPKVLQKYTPSIRSAVVGGKSAPELLKSLSVSNVKLIDTVTLK